MIANDEFIKHWIANNGVINCDPKNINPASLDLRLGDKFIDLTSGTEFQADTLTIFPGKAVLTTTLEYINMPDEFAGVIYLKSSMARSGLDFARAGWVDPGFHGELSLTLFSHRPVKLVKAQRVWQLVLCRMDAKPTRDYSVTGRYNGQRGPTEAR